MTQQCLQLRRFIRRTLVKAVAAAPGPPQTASRESSEPHTQYPLVLLLFSRYAFVILFIPGVIISGRWRRRRRRYAVIPSPSFKTKYPFRKQLKCFWSENVAYMRTCVHGFYVRFFFSSSHKRFRTWIRHVRMYTSFLSCVHAYTVTLCVLLIRLIPQAFSYMDPSCTHVRMYTSFLVPVHFFLENGSLLSRLAVRKGPLSSLLSHSVPAAPYAL